MRRTLFSFVALVLLLSITLPAQRRLPAPASVFGFEPGADYKLATYDQTIDYFKKLDAASDRMTLVEAGTSTQGRTYLLRAGVVARRTSRSIDRYREIARRLAHPEGLTDAQARGAGARRQGRSCTSTAGCIRPKSPARSTRRCCSYDLLRRLGRSGDRAHPRQRHPDAVADDQSRRPPDGRRLVHEERRHAGRERCRPASTRNTSATTTTATPTCST